MQTSHKPVSTKPYNSSRMSCRPDISFVIAVVQNSVCFTPKFPPPPQLGNTAKQAPTIYSYTTHSKNHSHQHTMSYVNGILVSIKHFPILIFRRTICRIATTNLLQFVVSCVKQWDQKLFNSFLNHTQITKN